MQTLFRLHQLKLLQHRNQKLHQLHPKTLPDFWS